VVVLLPLPPSVVEGGAVSYSVVVFPADTRVFVGIGLKESDVLSAPDVAFPVGLPVGASAVSRVTLKSWETY
jgi:hypothetical protein